MVQGCCLGDSQLIMLPGVETSMIKPLRSKNITSLISFANLTKEEKHQVLPTLDEDQALLIDKVLHVLPVLNVLECYFCGNHSLENSKK